jgi:ABC-type uncharacterized transport system involved in gliding motility auxiliary subunit
MASQWIKARQTQYAAFAAMYIAIVLTAVTVANVLANRYDKSYDATANKRYSLSDQTAKIVKGLKQDATITYFDQRTELRKGKDLLDQYANLSPKVKVDYVDADKNPQAARDAGVRNYGTAIVQIGAKHEEAKSLTEEGITGAFIRALKSNVHTVCFVSGSGEHQLDDSSREGLSRFKDLLSKDNYETRTINLLQTAEVPADCTSLVVAGPQRTYEQAEVDAIKKYVENGGRAMLLLDAPIQAKRLQISNNDALAGVLESWGVTPNKDLVIDMNPLGQLVGVGPEVVLVNTYESQPIVSDMKGTATGFPLSRSLDVKSTGKASVQKLFDSSNTSLATANLNSGSVNVNDPKNKKGPLTIAAAGSYDTGKEGAQGRFVVVGSSSWLSNGFIDFNGNSDLALNAVNWLSSDEDLISIRPKDRDERTITMTQAQFNWVRITSQFLLPAIVIFAGLGVWWKRR